MWLVLAGRGWGKTRTAVENIAKLVRGSTPLVAPKGAPSIISIVADNAFDMRQYSIEGPSGFLNVGPPSFRPRYFPGKSTLVWPNGCKALLFSAEDPEATRGASGSFFWWDELAKAKKAEMGWENMLFGMREGNPRGIVTTTPRPIPLIKRLMKAESTVLTVGSTWDNKANLSTTFYEQVIRPLEGTRSGRQEIHAEVVEDLPGALWTRTMIDAARVRRDVPELDRVIVSVDPSGARNISDVASAVIGITVVGRGVDGRCYVLADRSIRASPATWARRAVDAYHEFRADLVVAERNFGGAMVEHTIRGADANVSFKEVVAARGKAARAEPVSQLYERGLVSHVTEGQKFWCGQEMEGRDMIELEAQMCEMATDGYVGDGSPDRVDALVWAVSELFVAASTYDYSMDWVA